MKIYRGLRRLLCCCRIGSFLEREITQLGVYQPGKPIKEVQREFGLNKVIKLASIENPFGCSPIASAALQDELGNMKLYSKSTAPVLTHKIDEA